MKTTLFMNDIPDKGSGNKQKEEIHLIGEKIDSVRQKIEDTVQKCNRNPKEVTLIAVSKTKPALMIEEAYDKGVRDFGENKVQEILSKCEELPKDIRWHMIGHLQRNKVKSIVDKVYMIHSVDSERLAEEISKEAVKKGLRVPILAEVNIADEETKYGLKAPEVPEFIEKISVLPGILVKGLMTVAPYVENSEENRQYFVKLRQLFIDIKAKNIDNVSMDVLSMGMTGDYLTAIEEGSTYVRVGTGIFGERNYSIR